jgi:hypothetical protein
MNKEKQIIRNWLILFMLVLLLSGLTAIPVKSEINLLYRMTGNIGFVQSWVEKLQDGIHETSEKYPFLFYGYDWLAFAHFVLAILFIGPLRDPVRNKWVIEFGMIACLLIIPFALVAGYFRGIPFWWRLVDCSFGVIGLIPLSLCLQKIKQQENLTVKEKAYEN